MNKNQLKRIVVWWCVESVVAVVNDGVGGKDV